ncbi:MAG TPA: hypothetical protein VFQ00_11000 [Terriglobales bacterium]|nr:hypothetical protein [Terriglobales bacterium]
MSNARKQRPKNELQRELCEQLELLKNACESFDRGLEAAGKHIALTLRLLLHEHRNSRALLHQLGLRDKTSFLDTAGPLDPRNLLPECRLVVMQMGNARSRYIPAMGILPNQSGKLPFAKWWNSEVLKDKNGHRFTRGQLVLHVADTDGGAHADPELDEAYMAISRSNSLGWNLCVGDIETPLEGRPELACMRQIAHEVLASLSSPS